MADAFTVTWTQDKQLVDTAYQAQEIVPFAAQDDPIPSPLNTLQTKQVYSKSFNLAYIVIDGVYLNQLYNSSSLPAAQYFGLNFVHLITPSTTACTIPLFINPNQNINSLNDINMNFYVSASSSGIFLNYRYSIGAGTGYRNVFYCNGTIFIMS